MFPGDGVVRQGESFGLVNHELVGVASSWKRRGWGCGGAVGDEPTRGGRRKLVVRRW